MITYNGVFSFLSVLCLVILYMFDNMVFTIFFARHNKTHEAVLRHIKTKTLKVTSSKPQK